METPGRPDPEYVAPGPLTHISRGVAVRAAYPQFLPTARKRRRDSAAEARNGGDVFYNVVWT